MDKRDNPAPPPFRDDSTNGAESVPADPAIGSTIIFCGDPAQVSAGFALALKLMGMNQPAPDVSEHEPPGKGNLA